MIRQQDRSGSQLALKIAVMPVADGHSPGTVTITVTRIAMKESGLATNVSIIGGGQMGLVIADALVAGGATVRLWGPHGEHVSELAATRKSPDRLPGFILDDAVEVTAADESIASEPVDLLINAVPTQYIRSVWSRLADHMPGDVPIACVSKGIELDTMLRPTQVMADVLGQTESHMCVLSGPTIAAELAKRLPATMVASADDAALSTQVQELFVKVPWLRVYHHDDPLGVEIAGAAKNVIALAAGMIDGLGIGDNAKSALLARGLAEITRLGVAMGAKAETFFGIAGVGDLATTCFSPCGRNRSCGERLGKGESLQEILQSSVYVVEGVPTTRAIVELADRFGVELPICEAVRRILFEGMVPADAISVLMSRQQKKERVG